MNKPEIFPGKTTDAVELVFQDGEKWIYRNNILYHATSAVSVWVNTRLDSGSAQTLVHAIGILKPGTKPEEIDRETVYGLLVAGIYFWGEEDEGGRSDIWICVCADDISVATPQNIRDVLDFPFYQLSTRRVSAEIDASNERAIRQAEKLGFKVEGRKRAAGSNGSDMVILGLLPKDCPFYTEDEIRAFAERHKVKAQEKLAKYQAAYQEVFTQYESTQAPGNA